MLFPSLNLLAGVLLKTPSELNEYKRLWSRAHKRRSRREYMRTYRRSWLLRPGNRKKAIERIRKCHERIPGYKNLHRWVRRQKGKPLTCSKCGSSPLVIHWANIDHKYRKNIDDFIALCPPCHYRFDHKETGV